MYIDKFDVLVDVILTEQGSALSSPSRIHSYEQLPQELQYMIVDICTLITLACAIKDSHLQCLKPSSLLAFSLINKKSYALGLARRYSKIRLSSIDAASRFCNHHLHAEFNNPVYVRHVSVHFPSLLGSLGAQQLRAAVSQVPKESLQTFCAQDERNATYASETLCELLGPEFDIRELSLSVKDKLCFDLFDRVHIQWLQHLRVQASSQVLSTEQCDMFLNNPMQRTVSSIRSLDLGYIVNQSANYWGLGQHQFGNEPSNVFAAASQLASMTFRNMSFGKVISFDWTLFGKHGLETLRFLNCTGLVPILGSLAHVVSTWSNVHTLTLVLPDTEMHYNPETLRIFEKILCSLPCISLKRLRVEIPAAERLPNSREIVRHQTLESLVVAATNGDGRWIAYDQSDVEMIVRHCTMLQCRGLTLSPIEQCAKFSVSATSKVGAN